VSFGGELDPHIGVVLSLTHKRLDPFEPFTDHVLRSVVQDALRKAGFIHFDGLKSNFKSRKSAFGRHAIYMGREESIKAMKSNKVPLSWEIISILFDRRVYTVLVVVYADHFPFGFRSPMEIGHDINGRLCASSERNVCEIDPQ